MEELLATIPGHDIRDYMREALGCYMAGAYRGALVLSYIALFDDLLAKLGELANVNAAAKSIYDQAKKKKSDQDVFETYLIDQLASKNLISGLDSFFLQTLRDLRNKSAHPSGHKPSPEEARFVFFQTISRFLSQPVLSTTYLVDELITRLKNTNFFPSQDVVDIGSVVADEVGNLHEDAMPQLVSKLVSSTISTDPPTASNAAKFLVGLAHTAKPSSNGALQAKLISPKSDNEDYADIVLKVLSTNGKLFVGLNTATTARIRAAIAKKIKDVTGALSESHLIHPTSILISIASALPEDKFLATFEEELKSLFDKRAHSAFVVQMVTDHPSLRSLYLDSLLQRAGSNDFNTANSFANSAESLDEPLSAVLDDEQSFHLIVAVLKAADGGAWSSKALANTKFANMPKLRAKVLSHINGNKVFAAAYITQKLSESKSIDEFVSSALTDEE